MSSKKVNKVGTARLKKTKTKNYKASRPKWRKNSLRAAKDTRAYKSDKGLIDAVYRLNKDKIEQTIADLDPTLNAKKVFKNAIKEEMEMGLNVIDAIAKVSKSTIVTPVGERMARNLWSGLHKNKDILHEFRKFVGWKNKLNVENIRYVDQQDNVVIYEYAGVGEIHVVTIHERGKTPYNIFKFIPYAINVNKIKNKKNKLKESPKLGDSIAISSKTRKTTAFETGPKRPRGRPKKYE